MEYISNKVAYLKGLAEGMQLDKMSNEGKMLSEVLDVLGDICDALDGLSQAQNDLQSYAENIDDDMTDLEEFFMDLGDDDEESTPEDDDDLYEVQCPACGHVYLTDFESFAEDDVICPKCNTKFTLPEDTVAKLREADHHDHSHE